MDRCDECGFDYDVSPPAAAAAAGDIAAGAEEIATLVGAATTPDIAARRRPDVWSPLEYGCHVRDVLLVQRERVLLARREDQPSFAPMGRDERVVHEGYAEQDPAAVARQLRDAAAMLANALDRLGADWDRTVTYNYPQRSERSLRWLAVHTVHEVRHHLRDIRHQLT
jgi:DinB superfamily